MNNKKGLRTIAAVAALAFTVGAAAQDNPGGSAVETETGGSAPYIVGTLPFAAYELYANAGYLIYDTEARVTSPLGPVVVEDSGDEFTWSTGTGPTMFHTLNLRLEHEMFEVREVNNLGTFWLADAFSF